MVDWESFYNLFRQPDFVPGYEIQNRLGGGAFGEVYKARKLSIGKPYAIKFLKLDDSADKEAIERELEQVRLFASIDHPNLVTIEDMGLVHDVPYLIMGYAGEETLARQLKRAELERDVALRYFVQVCRGVLALHDRRLAHFDLKPGNVFLKGDVARVGDYGLAKLLVEGRQSLSFGRGTPHYMAPEMLKNRADHRADIYSLGVILFECLSGKLPYDSETQYGVIVRETDEPPAFPPNFHAPLRATVETCLRLDPDHRFSSVHELLEDMGQTARQGDSVRIPWKYEPLRDEPRAELPPAESSPPAEDPVTPRTAAAAGDDLRLAATELARGAVEVARGVWDGVRGKGEDEAETPRDRPTPTPDAAPTPGGDVVSFKTLEEPDDGAEAQPPAAALPAALAAGPAGAGAALQPNRALSVSTPLDGAAAGTVPVPPRDEGGFLGTMASAVVLGAEILGALVTGPVVYLLRGTASFVDHVVHGLPGVLGAVVRLVLFMLLFMGIGALVALIIMGGVMGGLMPLPGSQ